MDEAETVRLTYSEFAKARGITLAAARRMTLRHRWPKALGNDGLTRVSVPAAALPRLESDGTGTGNDDVRHAGNGAAAVDAPGTGTGDATAAIRALGDAVTSLGVQLARER